MGYDEECPFNPESSTREIMRFNEGTITLGEVILNPTKIYVDPVIDLLNEARGGILALHIQIYEPLDISLEEDCLTC